MPKYVVGCEDGHNTQHQKSFAEFEEFKEALNEGDLCGKWLGHNGVFNVHCRRPLYIKPQPTSFRMDTKYRGGE